MLMLTMGILTGCGSGPQTATGKKETEKKIVLGLDDNFPPMWMKTIKLWALILI